MLAPILAAERPWPRRTDPDPSTALRAHLLAAVLGCLPNTCCHLRKGGPQAALVLLPQHQRRLRQMRGHHPPTADRR